MKNEDYDSRFGKLLINNLVNLDYDFHQKLTIFIFIPMTLSAGILTLIMTFLGDFSKHPIFIGTPFWLVVPFMGFMLTGFAIQQAFFYLYRRHGICLFEKGFLWDGRWGKDDESDFTFFKDIETILIAPSRATAARLHAAVLTAGFGQPLFGRYNDWTYSSTELENAIRSSFGNVLIVQKQRFFDYDIINIKLSEIKDLDLFRSIIKELAAKNGIPFSDEAEISWSDENLEPILFRNVRDCERDFGNIVYEGFTKIPAHMFDRGILEWAHWPLEPSGLVFIFFDNLETILIQPSKKTALRYLEPMERIYYNFAPPDRKEACKIDPLEIEGRALKWENYIVMLLKSKRADTYCVEMKDLKEPRKFISLLNDRAKSHGIELIDESHLPSGTGEKLRIT